MSRGRWWGRWHPFFVHVPARFAGSRYAEGCLECCHIATKKAMKLHSGNRTGPLCKQMRSFSGHPCERTKDVGGWPRLCICLPEAGPCRTDACRTQRVMVARISNVRRRPCFIRQASPPGHLSRWQRRSGFVVGAGPVFCHQAKDGSCGRVRCLPVACFVMMWIRPYLPVPHDTSLHSGPSRQGSWIQ